MRRAPPEHREHGSIVLLALFSLSVIAFVFAQVAMHANTLFALARSVREGDLFRSALREGLAIPGAARRGCEEQQLSGGGTSQLWYVCSRGFVPFSSHPPIPLPNTPLDYDIIFATRIPCPHVHQAVSDRSFRNPVSPYTCTLSGSQSAGATLSDNISAHDLTLLSSRPNETLQLATPGTITITGVLSLSSDTLIIAGGDLRIKTLGTNARMPLSVTLLSAHGDVTLDEASGLISVVGIGRGGISIPPTMPSAHYPLPPVRPVRISGMIH
jgi:hypothetical protein